MAWVEYQARSKFQTIAFGRPTDLRLAVYAAGSLAAPSSGTVSIYNASHEALVDGAAVTITGSIATYDLLAAVVAAESYGTGWRVEWSLTMPDTYVHLFVEEAALVRSRLHPVITDVDLTDLYSDLATYRPSALSSFEAKILATWRDIEDELREDGRWTHLILSPRDLRRWHLHKTLASIFNDWAGGGDVDNKWVRLRDHHMDEAQTARSRLVFVYDEDGDGVPEDADRRRSARPQLFIAGRGPGSRRIY